MTKPKIKIEGDNLIRVADGARWSNAVMDWVLPRSKRKGVTEWAPARLGPMPKVPAPEGTHIAYFRRKGLRYGHHKLPRNLRTRTRLAGEQNWRCCYCERTMHLDENLPIATRASIEHVVPRSKGGNNSWNNLVAACNQCNTKRGSAFDAFEFFWLLRGVICIQDKA